MRHSLFGTGVAAAIGLLALASGFAQPPAGAPEVNPKVLAFLKPVEIPARDGELQKKLKERHNVAAKLLEERVNEYRKGVRDINSVFEAARLIVEAKLDLAETKQARAAVLEQAVEMAKLVEAHLEQQLKKGFGAKSELERARLARLNMEIELLRARGM